MPNPSPEVRKVDLLLDRFSNEQEFINFAQSPDFKTALHLAVVHLIDNWPTTEQIKMLRGHLLNEHRPFSQLDKQFLKGLEDGRNLSEVNDYNPSVASPEQDARLFWLLSLERPEQNDSYYKLKASLDGSVMSAVFAISKN